MSRKGFTLLELVITLSIAAVAGVLLIQLLVQNNGLFFQQQATVSQGLNLNNAVSQISNDIRSSNGVVSGYPIISPTILSSQSSLVISIPSIDPSGNVISNTYDYIVVGQDGQNSSLLREWLYSDPASSRTSKNRVLVKDLSLIRFYYMNSNGVVVSPTQASKINFVINISTKLGVSNQQSSSSAQVILRNI